MNLQSYTTHDIETLTKTGVYLIINKVNHKFYVGSASRIGKFPCESGFNCRFANHLSQLNKGKHHSVFLQRSWDKYGGENFEFQIIHLCSPEECIEFEQIYINLLSPHYNMSKVAGSLRGIKRSKEYVDNMVARCIKDFEIVNPQGELVKGSNLTKFCRDNNLSHTSLHAVIREKILNYNGWTKSLLHHQLLKSEENFRGITFDYSRKSWRVSIKVKGIWITPQRFYSLKEACTYRDYIEEKRGSKIIVTVKDWKNKLRKLQLDASEH